jgi:hypothetical protein
MKNRSKGGMIHMINATQITVSAIFPGDENKFVRNQPSRPVLATGAGSALAGASRR